MSKISEQMLKDEEIRMEYMFSYMEYFDKMFPQPSLSELDINQMESDQQRPLSQSKRIISQVSSNNNSYNPSIGA